MAPEYRRLVTQTSTLSGSSSGNDVGGRTAVVSNDGNRLSTPESKSSNQFIAPRTALADSGATVVSTQSLRGNSSSAAHGNSNHSGALHSNASDAATPRNDPGELSAAATSAVAAAAAAQNQPLQYSQGSNAAASASQMMMHHPQTMAAHQLRVPASQLSQPEPSPNIFKGKELRRGKWTPEEEKYAIRLIGDFEKGQVPDCENGITLRAYLSKKLHCAPMRISKKFAGKSIGKHVFLARPDEKRICCKSGRSKSAESLRQLEASFYRSLSDLNVNGESVGHMPIHMIATSGYGHFLHSTFGHHSPSLQFPPNPALLRAHVPPTGTASSNPAIQRMTSQSSWHSSNNKSTTENTSQPDVITKNGHAKHLHRTYLTAITQSPESNNNNKNPHQSSQVEGNADRAGDFGKRVAGTGGSSTASAKQDQSINQKQETKTSVFHATMLETEARKATNSGSCGPSRGTTDSEQKVYSSDIPEFLAGFEKVATTVLPSIDMISAGQFPPTPTYTSKSFDELHKFLGNDALCQNFQLNAKNEGPASEALSQQQAESISAVESKSTVQNVNLSGLPKPALPVFNTPLLPGQTFSDQVPHNGPMTADAYAMFAQQSVLAVSQHSAYYRGDPPKLAQFGVGTKKTALNSGPAQIQGSQKVGGDIPTAALISDDSTVSGSKFSAANLQAHAKAAEVNNGTAPFSSPSGACLRQHRKRARLAECSSEEFMTSTARLTRHANIISGSERSSSDMGTESESVIASSHASSTGSGSENASDNGSDNASVRSDSDGSGQDKAQSLGMRSTGEASCSFDRKRKQDEIELPLGVQ